MTADRASPAGQFRQWESVLRWCVPVLRDTPCALVDALRRLDGGDATGATLLGASDRHRMRAPDG